MDKFIIKKSYKDGHVVLRFSVKARSWSGDSIRIDGGSDLSTATARELARDLIAEADRADAKAAAKKASEDRRESRRQREIAAGRMQVCKGTGEAGTVVLNTPSTARGAAE